MIFLYKSSIIGVGVVPKILLIIFLLKQTNIAAFYPHLISLELL